MEGDKGSLIEVRFLWSRSRPKLRTIDVLGIRPLQRSSTSNSISRHNELREKVESSLTHHFFVLAIELHGFVTEIYRSIARAHVYTALMSFVQVYK